MDRLVPLAGATRKDRFLQFGIGAMSVAVAVALHVIFFYAADLAGKEYIARVIHIAAAKNIYTTACY